MTCQLARDSGNNVQKVTLKRAQRPRSLRLEKTAIRCDIASYFEKIHNKAPKQRPSKKKWLQVQSSQYGRVCNTRN